MFADPAVLTVNSVAKNLVRINQDRYSSEYLLRSATEEFRLFIRNTSRTDRQRGVSIDRHNVELVHTVFPVAPSVTSTIRKAYFVFENQAGDTLTDPVHDALALTGFLTQANLNRLVNQES